MILTAASCSTLNKPATSIGVARAGVNLPALPDDCRAQEPHAAISIGSDAVTIIKRERGATDKANARVTRCAGFYDNTRDRLGRVGD